MKLFALTVSGIASLTLPSCLDTQTTASSGQNRFGYNGTTAANTQPTSGVQQGVVNNAGTTPTVARNTTTQPTTSTQSSANDTIAIDRLPTNNTTSAVTNTATNSSAAVTNDTTASTSGSAAAVVDKKPEKPEYLYGIPVPGRDGMVYSPYNKDAGYIDVRRMKPGALAEDPYTPGKLFRVP